jgi:hypothetical protein
MAKYFLMDAVYDGQRYYERGTVASTADVGGTLPVDWIPPPCVDPMDDAAILAFHRAGPQITGWVRYGLPPPKVHW